MSHDVTRLEELLARVQKNAAAPRTARGTSAPAHPVPVQHAAAPPPVAFVPAAPAYVTPEPVFSPPSASAYVAPGPVFLPPSAPAYAAPEPVFPPPPAPPISEYSPPPPTFMDSVDDLLADPFPASSAPPAPIFGEVLEDPMPAPASTSEHISGVMPVADIADEPPEELFEDDIVEMSPDALAAEAAVSSAHSSLEDVDLNFDDEDEQPAREGSVDDEPPASSSRNRIAGTMDEALARASEQIEIQEGREVPLKTPPPESGPQAAMTQLPVGIHAPAAPDIDELLEADILPVQGVSAALPTAEQLGQTIDLEEARGPQLELDQPAPAALRDRPAEELEITLPRREFGGGYQEDLMPPPEARQDLDAHMQRVGDESIPAPPESIGQYPSTPPEERVSGMFAAAVAPLVSTESPSEAVSMVTIEASANAEFSPELLARPESGPGPVAKFIRADAPRPSTFLELLDASLALGRD